MSGPLVSVPALQAAANKATFGIVQAVGEDGRPQVMLPAEAVAALCAIAQADHEYDAAWADADDAETEDALNAAMERIQAATKERRAALAAVSFTTTDKGADDT